MKYLSLLCVTFLFSCSQSSDELRLERIKRAKENKGEITVGVAWPYRNDNFIKSIRLATEEINQSGGIVIKSGTLTKKYLIKLLFDYREGDEKTREPMRQRQNISIKVARKFSANPEVIAVIGHRLSYQAVPASIVYENQEILYLSPTSTVVNLTSHHFNYLFRLMPNNYVIGSSLASYADKMGFKRIIILHSRGAYGTELSDAFLYTGVEYYHLDIVFRHSFFSHQQDFTSLLVKIKRLKNIDAIFIVSYAPLAAKLYKQSRDMNITIPFIAGESMDTNIFWETVKEWESENPELKQNSVVPATYNLTSDKLTQQFVKKYKQRFNEPQSDRLGYLGYDSIKLLEHGIRRGNSILPINIADNLRYMTPCQGSSGQYQFSTEGDPINKQLYAKQYYQDHFVFQSFKKVQTVVDECGIVDKDNDGINNQIDKCPNNTKEELSKGISMRGIFRGCPIDSDKDNIPDYRDKCPKSSQEEKRKGVDAQGCVKISTNEISK